jgi:transcriptional activator SPT8
MSALCAIAGLENPHCIATTAQFEWLVVGDRTISTFDVFASINGRKRHAPKSPFVSTSPFDGVLVSSWETLDTIRSSHNVSARSREVFSLAVQSEGVWILSGSRSGDLDLWSAR